ncbi:MAG: hypothetical protein C0501_31505 [Isosphaera sp.]|nr:hypothetical protein [Isosphaera sp.]
MIVLSGPLKTVDRVALSPDGAHVAAAGGTARRLAVWAVREPDQPRYLLPAAFDRRYWHFAFDPAGGLLLVGDSRGVTARDPADGAEVWRLPTRDPSECGVGGLDVSRDGRELLACLWDAGREWDWGPGFGRWELNGRDPPARRRGARARDDGVCQGVALLPGTTSFAWAEDHDIRTRAVGHRYVVDYQARVHVVSAAGRTTHTLTAGFESVHQLAASADGRCLAAQFPPAVLVWDVGDLARPPRELRPDRKARFTGVAFHPSGRYLATTSNDAAVKLYDTTSWQVAKTYTWDVGRMRSVAFSPDGSLAAAGTDTGKVVVWDVDG